MMQSTLSRPSLKHSLSLYNKRTTSLMMTTTMMMMMMMIIIIITDDDQWRKLVQK